MFLVDFGHCFVTILKFWRFPELLTTPSESSPRDLQSESGPGAAGAQQKHENIGNTLNILQKRNNKKY